MTVGEVFMKRKRAGLRQRELTQKLRWNTETLVDIERERLTVTEDTLGQISDAIDSLVQEKSGREEVAA